MMQKLKSRQVLICITVMHVVIIEVYKDYVEQVRKTIKNSWKLPKQTLACQRCPSMGIVITSPVP